MEISLMTDRWGSKAIGQEFPASQGCTCLNIVSNVDREGIREKEAQEDSHPNN